MKQTSAAVIGMIAASILPAAYLAILHPLSGERDIQSIVGTFLVAYFFSAVAALFLGIPVFLVLNRLKLVYWWSAAGSGALVGAISLATIRFGGVIDVATSWRFVMLGACAGLIFWAIWRLGHTGPGPDL